MKSPFILLPLLTISVAGDNNLIRKENIGQLKSYCESETFRARCWPDHVVVMQSAVYGRMRIGRCVEADLGHLGCQKDVMAIADRKCSARQECEIRIPDGDLDATKPCYKELKVYFEANYSCLRVLGEDQTCSQSATPSPSHISSVVVSRHDCGGSETQPWSIHADPGQHVSVSLIDLSHSADDESSEFSSTPQSSCVVYGYIMEGRGGGGGGVSNKTICGSQKRVSFVYESKSNAVEVVIVKRRAKPDAGKFIVQFQAKGCADLRPLKDTWISRTKDEVIVGCNLTSQTWHLTCRGHQWVGVIGNCTQRLLAAQTEARLGMPLANFSSDILIVAVVSISLILCLIIILTGIAYVRSWSVPGVGGLSSAAIDYTSVVASDYNCEGGLNGDGVVKKCSYVPSVMSSFDYTEMLQPPPQPQTAMTPGHRSSASPAFPPPPPPAYPSANVVATATASHGQESQMPEVQRDCKTDGYARTFSDNL